MNTLRIARALLLTGVAANVSAGDLQSDLMAMEKSGWQAWGNHDASHIRKTAAADLVQTIAGVGRISGLDAVAEGTLSHTCKMASFDLHNPALRQLTPDVAILSYEATQSTTCDGKALPAKLVVTAVYTHADGAWMMRSYQETPVE